ncbi:MAG: hypothetical protein AAGI23_18830 [Bacteroidota bacterium]
MRTLLFLISGIFFFTACDKINLNNAEDSLEGDWQVVRMEQTIGERVELGVQVDSFLEFTGQLGAFSFQEEVVSYTFSVGDSVYQAMAIPWTLTREKRSEGFGRVEQYTLSTPELVARCEFGDQTSDAEQNATQVLLIWQTEAIGAYEMVTLYLEKE